MKSLVAAAGSASAGHGFAGSVVFGAEAGTAAAGTYRVRVFNFEAAANIGRNVVDYGTD